MLALFVLLFACVPLLIFVLRGKNSARSEIYSFQLPDSPRFLTEELALQTAYESLKLAGFDTNTWKPMPDNRTKSPAGIPDMFMTRNVDNPNDAKFLFTNVSRRRIISVELTNQTILARIIRPK
jgi:hypothetical protein